MARSVFTGKFQLAGEGQHPIDPLLLSQTRTTFSLLVLFPLLVGRGGWRRIQIPRPDLIQCLILGILGVAVSNYFYYLAIQKTSVAIAIVLQYTAPVWVLLYVVAQGQQKLTLQKVASVVVAIAGIALTIGIIGGRSTSPLHLDRWGLIAAMVASFSFAFYNLAGHRILARHDRWRVLSWTLASASVFWLMVNPPWKVIAAQYTSAQWAFLLVFSMISVLGPFSL
jgi:drug/metabolite transporter (DMT)-like permease